MNFDDPMSIMGLVGAAFVVLIVLGIPILIARFYRKVDQGQALIINTLKDVKVAFTGSLVWPVIHRAEVMDISVKTIEIDRRGKDGLICRDNIRADIKVSFFVRVNQTDSDVLRVAQSVGCNRASDPRTLEELFGAKFSEALKTVGKQLDFEELYKKREAFRDEIKRAIGDDLNGYSLEDAAIDYLEQTPVSSLDPNNILDAVGIRKITELTSEQRVQTTELANEAEKRIGKNNLDTKMAIFEYEKQEADAHARQQREIESVRAREAATAAENKAKELARQETARLEAEQIITVRAINKQREEEVATKNRERVLAVEIEAVEKERALQVIARQREVALKEIERDRELELEKKNIAEVVRDRIAVEKNVAQEEEYIKDLREIAEAERKKKVLVLDAEATAQQSLVASIKAAEANEEVAKFEARQRMVMADAELDAADRVAKAKIRTAEGVQAEIAAEGLALVRVREADALALEKQGLVEARILREKMEAEAKGREQQGLVEVRLKQADVEALEAHGLAEARILREKMEAEATGLREKMGAEAHGLEQKGLVDVHVKEASAKAIELAGLAETRVLRERAEAEAAVIEKRELAEATGIRERLIAEADGLEKKAAAMKALDEVSRVHEEFRLTLEQERLLVSERLKASIEVAKSQAQVLAEAFKAANINVVGGDEAFFNRFLNSVSLGQSIDGFVNNSETARRVAGRLLGGRGESAAGEGADTRGSDNDQRNRGQSNRGPIDVSNALKDLLAQVPADKRAGIEALVGKAVDAVRPAAPTTDIVEDVEDVEAVVEPEVES